LMEGRWSLPVMRCAAWIQNVVVAVPMEARVHEIPVGCCERLIVASAAPAVSYPERQCAILGWV